MRKACIILISIVFVAGCASFNDAMTPSLQVTKDEFDGSLIVRQKPVGSSNSLAAKAYTMIGWEWRDSDKNWTYLTVGVSGIVSVRTVAFKADGVFYKGVEKTDVVTDFNLNPYLDWSWGQFRIPTEDFLAVSRGTDIMMQVITSDGDVVAKFGPANPGAVIDTKLGPFVAKMEEIRAGS